MNLSNRWRKMRQAVSDSKAEAKEEKRRRKQMKVYRTMEGTLFEVGCGLLLVVTWCLAIVKMLKGQGIPYVVPYVILSLATIVLLVCAYRPHLVNMKEKIENARQLAIMVRSVRMCALWMALLTFFLVLNDALTTHLPDWMMLVVTVPIIVSLIYFTYQIKKAK